MTPPNDGGAAKAHGWSINITCPRCRHVGNADTSIPCCDCVAEVRRDRDDLAALVRERDEEIRLLRAAISDVHSTLYHGDMESPVGEKREAVIGEALTIIHDVWKELKP